VSFTTRTLSEIWVALTYFEPDLSVSGRSRIDPRAMSLINTAVGLLAISSPIGVLPVVARAACWWGQALVDLFGITLDAFRVAGGLILLPIGLHLIEGMEVSHPDVESDEGSLGVVPIGLPLLAGPGAISLVVADSPAAWQGRIALSGVITVLALGIYAIHRVAMPLRRALGELQEQVISRLMGLLLSAIGVQMLVGGLRGCFPVLAGAD
jgi:multiple antibiotic resistance protein